MIIPKAVPTPLPYQGTAGRSAAIRKDFADPLDRRGGKRGVVSQSGSKYRTSGFAERPPLRRSRRGKLVGGGTEISTSTRSLIGYLLTCRRTVAWRGSV